VSPARHARVVMPLGARSTPWRGGGIVGPEGGRGGGATGPKGGGEERGRCQTSGRRVGEEAPGLGEEGIGRRRC
jgi:hypothetical protein